MTDDIIPGTLVETVRPVVNLIADREWVILSRVAARSRVEWPDVARTLDQYPYALTMLPNDPRPLMDGVMADDGTWSIRCAFWTEEEGRSDLEVQITAREIMKGIWRVEVDDVLVA